VAGERKRGLGHRGSFACGSGPWIIHLSMMPKATTGLSRTFAGAVGASVELVEVI
jgi:hypothetical protein